MIIHFSHFVTVNISSFEIYNSSKIEYKSHLEELSNHNQKAFFRFDNQMYTQEKDNLVSQSKWGIHKNVTFISLFVCKEQKKLFMENVNDFTFGKDILLKLHKQNLKFLSEKEFEEKQKKSKEYFRVLNQTEERKEKDKERDRTPKRKAEHQAIDRKRYQTPKRKADKQATDKKRDLTSKRKAEH